MELTTMLKDYGAFILIIALAVVVYMQSRDLSALRMQISKLYYYTDPVTVGAMYVRRDGTEYAMVTEIEITDDEYDQCVYNVFKRDSDDHSKFRCVREASILPLFDFYRVYPNVLVETDHKGDPTDVPVIMRPTTNT